MDSATSHPLASDPSDQALVRALEAGAGREGGEARQEERDRRQRAGGASSADSAFGLTIMPYHVYTCSGAGALGVIVETARDALAKAPEFVEDRHPEVIFKDLLGNLLDHAALVAQAENAP